MSSDDPFELLDLDRKTATDGDVRRAYARKLKTTRPDEDPKAFMALRSAMEQARNEIRWRAYDEQDDNDDEDETDPQAPVETRLQLPEGRDTPQDLIDEALTGARAVDPLFPTPEDKVIPSYSAGADWHTPADVGLETSDHIASDEDIDQDEDDTFGPEEEGEVKAVGAAVRDMERLLDETNTDWSSWQDILDRDDIQSLNAFQMLSYRARSLICDRTEFNPENIDAKLVGGVTAEILLGLDDRFGWSKQAISHWYESQQNTWIRRLTEEADFKTSRKTNGAWGRPPARRIEVINADGTLGKPPGKPVSAVASFAWLVFRIVAIIALMRGIGTLLDKG